MNDSPPLSILILEDQHVVRMGMRALIQISEPRATVQEASSYEEAIDRLANGRFDLAFLDIDLKDGNSGIDVLKYIRGSEMDIKAIMLSANEDRDVVLECISSGASGFIGKSTEDDNVFRHALDTIFSGSVFLPPKILGKGGFSPSVTFKADSLESLGISGRLAEVLYYLCQGLPNKAIEKKMNIEEGTIRKDYVPRLFRIFKVARRTELIIEVARRKIILSTPKLVVV
jgi:two-component system nitrate/nitrite response regulator NarL